MHNTPDGRNDVDHDAKGVPSQAPDTPDVEESDKQRSEGKADVRLKGNIAWLYA
jgi:hypothetical protein